MEDHKTNRDNVNFLRAKFWDFVFAVNAKQPYLAGEVALSIKSALQN